MFRKRLKCFWYFFFGYLSEGIFFLLHRFESLCEFFQGKTGNLSVEVPVICRLLLLLCGYVNLLFFYYGSVLRWKVDLSDVKKES